MNPSANHRKSNRFDHRKSDRFRHESIIMIKDEHIKQPFFAMMHNASKNGLYFESLFSLGSGTQISIESESVPLYSNRKRRSAKVIWCRELADICASCYGVGVEFC